MEKHTEKQLATRASGEGIVIRVWAYEDDFEAPFVSISRVDVLGEYSTLTVSARDLVDVLALAEKKLASVGAEIAS